MGLFDFLKPKPTRGKPETMQQALDALGDKLGGKPRFWHYFMSHVALRDIALRGEGLPPSAAEPGRAHGFFAMILGEMAERVGLEPAEAQRLAAGFAISHRRIGDLDVAFVRLPPPEGPTECHFVARVPAGGGRPALLHARGCGRRRLDRRRLEREGRASRLRRRAAADARQFRRSGAPEAVARAFEQPQCR
jgi:hypothetical protein